MLDSKQETANKQTKPTHKYREGNGVARREGSWGVNEEGKGSQIHGEERRKRLGFGMVSTQKRTQMLYYKIVHLKFMYCY